ncbi:MAG: hypothetical protein GX572_00235 [Clostridia bacterium]|nr:hypothetical protein [Clostridia bacterium]
MLKDLFALQCVELAERAVHDERAESAELQQLRQIKAALDGLKENLYHTEQEMSALSEQLADFPRQIKELEARLIKENQAIYDGSVVNLRELSAREAQAAALSEKLKELQNLQALYQGEQQQKDADCQKIKKSMAADYQRFIELKSVYQELERDWRRRLGELGRQRKKMAAAIEPQELQWYESVKCRCNGAPLAMLNEEHVCCGCHTIVPPITFKRTKLGQRTYCEKCGRTLFVEEEIIEIEADAEQPEKKRAN